MSSGCRKHSLLFTFCAFIALLLMSGSAAISAHARAVMLLHGVVPCSASVDSQATSAHAGWQQASSSCDSSDDWLLVDDHDVDDGLLLPSPVHVLLDYFSSAAPLSRGASSYPAPVTSPLRPPNLA
jgi:hypothetical protein